jgi:hypothetical protein
VKDMNHLNKIKGKLPEEDSFYIDMLKTRNFLGAQNGEFQEDDFIKRALALDKFVIHTATLLMRDNLTEEQRKEHSIYFSAAMEPSGELTAKTGVKNKNKKLSGILLEQYRKLYREIKCGKMTIDDYDARIGENIKKQEKVYKIGHNAGARAIKMSRSDDDAIPEEKEQSSLPLRDKVVNYFTTSKLSFGANFPQ